MAWFWDTKNVESFLEALTKAAKDFRANQSRPIVHLTGEGITQSLNDIEAAIPVLRAWVASNPGALTAADDLLDALTVAGVPWAKNIKSDIDSATGALTQAADVLSSIDALLKGTAGFYVPGPGAYRGR